MKMYPIITSVHNNENIYHLISYDRIPYLIRDFYTSQKVSLIDLYMHSVYIFNVPLKTSISCTSCADTLYSFCNYCFSVL